MRVKPGKFKVKNSFSSEWITCEIRPDGPLNWPTAISKMMELDPVHDQQDRLNTPLFRDTRGLIWDPALNKGSGGFPPGTKPMGGADALPYYDMLTILRALIQAESGHGMWFEGRSGPFGLHSFRIGRP